MKWHDMIVSEFEMTTREIEDPAVAATFSVGEVEEIARTLRLGHSGPRRRQSTFRFVIRKVAARRAAKRMATRTVSKSANR